MAMTIKNFSAFGHWNVQLYILYITFQGLETDGAVQ